MPFRKTDAKFSNTRLFAVRTSQVDFGARVFFWILVDFGSANQ
jgi:hypothetical protein